MKYNIENRIKDTAIVNLTDFQNAIDLYEEGEIEKALELTFGLITLGLGSDFETDDREVRRLLRNREYTVIKSNETYCNKLYSKEEGQRNKLQLDDIAEMMANGATQQIIADSLSVSLDTIKYRVKIMKEKFPALYTESVKKCKKVGVSGSNGNVNDNVNGNVNDNVNDNDNDNVKDKIEEREGLEERGAATPPATTENSEIQKNQVIENSEIQKKAENAENAETKTQEEPRRLEETTINYWNRSELGVIGEIDNEKDLIAYLEILFGDHLTSKVKSQLQVALKTMSAKQIARFYFYCDQKEHRKFLRGSEMTLGLLQFDDIKERANTYWTNLDNRRKQFTKDYNSWQLDQKEIIVKIPQNKHTKRRAYTKEEIEAMV